MKMYPKAFPYGRRKRPKRRAERRVYEALADCGRQGFCYYEWRKGHEQIELDFAVWIEGLGRFALQVKGGHYRLVDGDWHLQTRDGLKAVASCPLDEAKLSALDLHDDIKERTQTDYNPFVIPVLVFPDMHYAQTLKGWPVDGECTWSGEPEGLPTILKASWVGAACARPSTLHEYPGKCTPLRMGSSGWGRLPMHPLPTESMANPTCRP